MTKRVFVVPHTHWDREWFFTSAKAKVYLLKDLKDVFDCLEKSDAYKHFLLDGQSSLIDDYLKWRPQDLNRVKKLVREKKLILGPWYTQTDQFMVSGESIVNNLRIGMEESDHLGGHMNIAYVPDSFGQESSMPQIYRSFEIDDAVLYRGFSLDSAKQSEFIWEGEDGSRVNVFRMACGYFIGGVVDEEKLAELMKEEPFKTVVSRAATDNILFPNGSDMAPLRFDLPSFISKLNEANKGKFTFKVSSLEEYIASVKEDHPKLMKVSGEQDCGKDMRVHKSISSSRADIKKLNTNLQNYLSNVMEPILAMGDYYGLDYPKETVEDIWKKMFENAAHDSMGNCVSDSVNNDIKHRYLEVRDIATSLVDVTLRQISTQVKGENHPISLTVFNTLPYKRKAIVNKTLYSPSRNFKIQDKNGTEVPFEIKAIEDVTELINGSTIQLDPGEKIYLPTKVYQVNANIDFSNIPSFGYKQFYLLPLEDHEVEIESPETGSSIENEFYQITVNNDGSLNILDKLNNHLYQKQAIIEENGDDGDSYNYSPAKRDLIIYSTNQEFKSTVGYGNYKTKLTVEFNFMVPSNLEMRAQRITDIKMPVRLNVTLTKHSKIIEFEVEIDNTKPKSHRLCIDFDTEVVAKSSIADIQFGSIKRPLIKAAELADWYKNQNKWQEKPISINTMQSFVAMSDEQKCVAIAPDAVREYECVGKNNATIRLTIFRTYEMLGKRNLLYRPGRPSGDETVSTPDAQLNQKLTFKFAMTTYQAEYDRTKLANDVKEFETPLQVYEYAEFLNGRLTFPFNPVKRKYEEKFSLFETTNSLAVSTIEKDPRKKGYIVRMYNANFHAKNEKIRFYKKPKTIQLVNLSGTNEKSLELKNNNVVVLPKIEHSKFITVYFEF